MLLGKLDVHRQKNESGLISHPIQNVKETAALHVNDSRPIHIHIQVHNYFSFSCHQYSFNSFNKYLLHAYQVPGPSEQQQ